MVGDLHGCLEPLSRLLSAVKFDEKRDRLFCVGDLVDRGPQSLACLNLLRMPWFYGVMGNHEYMLLTHLKWPNRVRAYDEDWLKRIASGARNRKKFAAAWVGRLEQLPMMRSVGDGPDRFHVVHGEIVENRRTVTNDAVDSWEWKHRSEAERQMIGGRRLIRAWERGLDVTMAQHPDKFSMTFCGHTVTGAPGQVSGQVYIDTGAFVGYTHRLSRKRRSLQPEQIPDEVRLVGMRPGLTLVEPLTRRAWFAPTGGLTVDEIDLLPQKFM